MPPLASGTLVVRYAIISGTTTRCARPPSEHGQCRPVLTGVQTPCWRRSNRRGTYACGRRRRAGRKGQRSMAAVLLNTWQAVAEAEVLVATHVAVVVELTLTVLAPATLTW